MVQPYIDPQMSKVLERIRSAGTVDYRAMPIVEARKTYASAGAVWNDARVVLTRIEELSIDGPAGPIRSRLYHPGGEAPLPVLIFVHGGGWTFGSIDTHDGVMRYLAQESGCAVLGIDYRLAPEHPFPAGLDDLKAAINFVQDGRLGKSVDPKRLALAGDSAGANLSLAALISVREGKRRTVVTAALFYGSYAPLFDTESQKRFGDGSYRLGASTLRWYWRNFLGSEPDDSTCLAAPLRSDLSDLPQLYLNAASLDPLLDDTLLLSQRLSAAGVGHRLDVFPGVVHGFMRMTKDLSAGRAALRAAGEYLRRALSQP